MSIDFVGRCDEGLQTLTGEPCEVGLMKTREFREMIGIFLGPLLTFVGSRKKARSESNMD